MYETLAILVLFLFLNLIFIIRQFPMIAIPIAVITFYMGSSRLFAITSLDSTLDIMLSFTLLICACVNMWLNAQSFRRKRKRGN